jgi:16S rRNA processing protein RimM
MKSELLDAAKIGKAVGLRGDLKLHNLGDFPEQFKKGAKFALDSGGEIEIASYNPTTGLVRFVGVNDRDAAQRLTNKILLTTKSATREACELDEGEFFWFDIVGCEVVEAGHALGVVSEIERIAEQDYLRVRVAEELVHEGLPKSFLIPYIDRFVERVDIEARLIECAHAMELLENS